MDNNKLGRPLKFETPEALQIEIDKYFNETPPEEYAICGLALALDTDRVTLIDYSHKDEFTNTIKQAKLKIELAYEKRLVKRGNSGDIFALKNFGWQDRQEIKQEITGNLSLGKAFEILKQDANSDN